jgi:hypothetical protein
MESVIEVCGEQLVGWYGGVDRLRIGGILRSVQQPGAAVNFMKWIYPGEDRPLRHFPELTGRLRRGVEKLVLRGVPYLEAKRVSDPAVQAWLSPLYEASPRVGSVVAIVRTIEGVNSFSCRPRKHRVAKGDPRTGRRPVEVAEHHLVRGKHNIGVYYFYLYDQHWGRCSVRIGSYLPFDVSLQLNGHEYLERQMRRQRRGITMAANAVAKVADWEAFRKLSGEPLEPAVRRFAAYWLSRLPHGLSPDQIKQLGGYYLYIQAVEACRNFVFRSAEECRPFFETLLRHNQMLGSPDSIRYLFGISRRSRRTTSGKVTLEKPMGCFKAFYGTNWVKCYDKQGFILRFEIVMNLVTDFVASKSLSNLHYLTRFGQNVCRRLERTCLTAVSCPVSAGAYKSLVEPGTDAFGRRYPAIRPERPAQQDLLATILSLQHCAKGFSAREIRTLHQKKHGVTLKPSQASYRLRVLRAHGLIEQVGKCRRYQLSQPGRPIVTFLVKLYTHFIAPVVQAATNGIHRFRTAVAQDPIAQALDNMFTALGIGTPRRIPA